jgi:plastocyanin
VKISGILRQVMLCGALATAAAVVIAGCAGGSAYGGGTSCLYGNCGSPSPSPSPNTSPSPSASPSSSPSASPSPSSSPSISPSPAAQTVGLAVLAAPTIDPTYGMVKGFLNGTAPLQSAIIHVTHGATIHFQDVENGIQHTAADLGTWKGSFPPNYNGPPISATPSPAGTDISATGFTTGSLNGGGSSAMYTANIPGIYVFGCAYHYDGLGMRTVIIVQ